jgi:type IV pilus assembly protein PilN
MIRINLLPLREAERAVGRRNQMSLVALGATISALIMVVPYMIQGRQIGQVEAQIRETQDEIAIYNKKVAEVRDLDRLRADVQAKLQVVQDLNDKRIGPARVLHDLSIATPENLWLLDFNEGNANATLTGMALDNETIARFMRQLSASDYFVAVDLVETSRRAANDRTATGDPLSFTRFIVKASIDYFGRDGQRPEGVEGAAELEVEAKAARGREKNS